MSGKNPTCPKCGAMMVLQTARKGRFTGRQFYGCPNWRTTCKGVIVNIGDENQPQQVEHTDISESQNILTPIPVLLNARERFESYRTLFFQNIAVPKELLDASNKEEISRENLLRFGQWRLDFPATVTEGVETPEDIRKALLVTRKILTRGRVTLLSPFLEEKLRNRFSFKKFDVTDKDNNVYFSLATQRLKTTTWFDGKKSSKLDGLTPEHYFYEKILSQCFGHYYKRFILPQVH